MAEKERPLVQLLSTEPCRDFTVVLARVARGASRNDILEGVAPAPGDRHHAVTLKGFVGGSAVGTTRLPCLEQRVPLVVGEVIVDLRQPSPATLGIARAFLGRTTRRWVLAASGHGFTLEPAECVPVGGTGDPSHLLTMICFVTVRLPALLMLTVRVRLPRFGPETLTASWCGSRVAGGRRSSTSRSGRLSRRNLRR